MRLHVRDRNRHLIGYCPQKANIFLRILISNRTCDTENPEASIMHNQRKGAKRSNALIHCAPLGRGWRFAFQVSPQSYTSLVNTHLLIPPRSTAEPTLKFSDEKALSSAATRSASVSGSCSTSPISSKGTARLVASQIACRSSSFVSLVTMALLISRSIRVYSAVRDT